MEQRQDNVEELVDIVVAYHEAGHAVAAHCLDQANYGATIMPNGDAGGVAIEEDPLYGVEMEWDASDDATARALKEIVICLAGVVAQVKFRGSSCRPWHFDGDYNSAYKRAMGICRSPEQTDAVLDGCESEAERLVDANWGAVQALASALLDKNTLNGAEVSEVLRSETP